MLEDTFAAVASHAGGGSHHQIGMWTGTGARSKIRQRTIDLSQKLFFVSVEVLFHSPAFPESSFRSNPRPYCRYPFT